MIGRLDKEVDMLQRHLEVLRMVLEDEPIGIVNMSNESGYRHHKVRYSLRVLQEENLIKPTNEGAVTTKRTNDYVDNLDDKVDDLNSTLNGMKIEDEIQIEQ